MDQQVKDKLIPMVDKIAEEAAPFFKENKWSYYYSKEEYASKEDIKANLLHLIRNDWDYWDEDLQKWDRSQFWESGRMRVYRNGKVALCEARGEFLKEWSINDSKQEDKPIWKSGWLL